MSDGQRSGSTGISGSWLQLSRILALVVTLAAGFVAGAAPAWHTSPQASVLVVGGSMMNGDHFGDASLATMREHYAGCRKVALVLHPSHPSERDRMEARLQKAFAHIGVPAAESLHRRDETGAAELLRTADAIFVGGGETFVLLAELHRTGQLALIRERVRAGVPYGGSSAGANVAGLLIGTTNDFPVADIPSREALGLVPVTINPHHPLPEQKADYAARVGKIRGYLLFNPGESVLALADASIFRLSRGRAALVTGRGWLYTSAGQRELKLKQPVPELGARADRP